MLDKNALIEQFMPLATKLAYAKKRTLPKHIDFDDLQSAAYLGLVKAASRYDESKNVAFTTFSWPHINGSINDYLRSLGFVRNLSLDYSDSDDGSLKDLIEAEADSNSFNDVLEVVAKNLGDQAGTILECYFGKDIPMKEVGITVGLTEGRVSQLISSYKEQIRTRWTKEELLEELAA